MCNLYSLETDPAELAERFGYAETPADYQPGYVAPTKSTLAVVSDRQKNRVGLLRFGLIPRDAKSVDSVSGGRGYTNARVETLDVKLSFCKPFRNQRCLILADGFYEWKAEEGKQKKTKVLFRLKSREPFAFAGIWDRWRSSEGEEIVSCAIVTCGANELVEPVHERMPVILPDWFESSWLNRDNIYTTQIKTNLRPYHAREMVACTGE